MRVAVLADCHLDHGTHRLWADGAWERATRAIAEGGYYCAVVAGDLFHTGKPLPEAMLRCVAGLRLMADAGVHVVVIAGNHEWIGIRSIESHRPPTLLLNEIPGVTAVIQPEGLRIGDDLWLGALPWPAPGAHHSGFTQAEEAKWLAEEASGLTIPKLVVAHAAVGEAMDWCGGSEQEMCSASTPTHTLSQNDLDYPDVFGHTAIGHFHKRQSLSPTCGYVGGLEAFTFADENRIGAWSSFELAEDNTWSDWIESRMECGLHRFATVAMGDDLSALDEGTIIRVRIKDGESRYDFDISDAEEAGLLFSSWKDERREVEAETPEQSAVDDAPLVMNDLLERWAARRRLTEQETGLLKASAREELGWEIP